MSKEAVMKHPCMTMCWVTNGIVIRTRYKKGEEPKGGGEVEGRHEGLREVKGRVSGFPHMVCLSFY